MASPAAFDAIHDYLVAQWNTDDADLFFENEPWALRGTPAPFVFVEIFSSTYDQASIGGGDQLSSNLWREEGQLYGHVLIPNGTGSRDGRVLAKTFLDLFRGQDIGVVTFRGGTIGAGRPGTEDGSYFRITATLDWQRDETP